MMVVQRGEQLALFNGFGTKVIEYIKFIRFKSKSESLFIGL